MSGLFVLNRRHQNTLMGEKKITKSRTDEEGDLKIPKNINRQKDTTGGEDRNNAT